MAAISKTAVSAPTTPVKPVEDPTKKVAATIAKKPEPDKPAKVGDNAKTEYIAKVGDVTYRLSAGEILVTPIAPELRCSTRRFSQARFVVVDPNAVFFAEFRKESDVTVSIGFQNGKIVEKFKGKIKNVGRVEPFGTLIVAIDNLAQLGNSAASGTNDAGVVPPADGRKTDQDRSKRKVSKTLSYTKIEKTKLVKGAKLKDGSPYDPATMLVFSTGIPDKSTVTISIPGATEFVDAVVSSGAGGAANTLVLSEGAHAKITALANKDKKPFKLEVYTLPAEPAGGTGKPGAATPTAPGAAPAKPGTATTAEQAVLNDTKLKYSKQTPSTPAKDGGSTLQQTTGKKIVQDAVMKGDVVIAKGNTIAEVSANQANQTKVDLILDYKYSRPAFFGEPILTVKTPLVVNSGVGTLTINGWNVNNKEGIQAVVATPVTDGKTPTVQSFASPTGAVKSSELIYPGSLYTWGDALFKDGAFRKPDSDEVYKSVIRIAQVVTQYTTKVGKGKWKINSWYRNTAANNACGGSKNSRHLAGDAVDFIFPGMAEFYEQVRKEWSGGVAIRIGVFVHLDDRPTGRHPNPPASAKTGEAARWIYGAGGKAV